MCSVLGPMPKPSHNIFTQTSNNQVVHMCQDRSVPCSESHFFNVPTKQRDHTASSNTLEVIRNEGVVTDTNNTTVQPCRLHQRAQTIGLCVRSVTPHSASISELGNRTWVSGVITRVVIHSMSHYRSITFGECVINLSAANRLPPQGRIPGLIIRRSEVPLVPATLEKQRYVCIFRIG